MTRFVCGKTKPCCGCGGCCKRDEKYLSDEEDMFIRKKIFTGTGVIYLYPTYLFTFSLTTKEKVIVQGEAKKLGIDVDIKPKKIIYDKENDQVYVLDWFMDNDICPFLGKDCKCSIYSKRPQLCKDFPKIRKDTLLNAFQKDKFISRSDSSYEEIIKIVKKKVKADDYLAWESKE